MTVASLRRRMGCLVYEAILLFGVLFLAMILFLAITQGRPAPVWIIQTYLFSVLMVYYVWQWRRGGQTLPMKTWKLRLVDALGETPSLPQAMTRYVLACISLIALGLGFAWAIIDRDRLFLHDRLANTRIVNTN